jgi:hypothetical protein
MRRRRTRVRGGFHNSICCERLAGGAGQVELRARRDSWFFSYAVVTIEVHVGRRLARRRLLTSRFRTGFATAALDDDDAQPVTFGSERGVA